MPTSAYLQNFTCETQQLGDNLSLLYDCMSSVADAAPNNNNKKKKNSFLFNYLSSLFTQLNLLASRPVDTLRVVLQV